MSELEVTETCIDFVELSKLSGLSEKELNEFQEIFNLVDTDGGGTISSEEVGPQEQENIFLVFAWGRVNILSS